jgi:hypothetical protein|tara:strand:+ start:109 stop:417 length:309 start_codon:yes stop_codon:yes gene_type:complete
MTEIIYILIALLLAELTKVGLIILSPIISSKIALKIKSNRIIRFMFDAIITLPFLYLMLIITEMALTYRQWILVIIIGLLSRFYFVFEDSVDNLLEIYEDDE